MGQEEVLNVLREHKDKWMTIKDIKEELKKKGYTNGVIDGVNKDLNQLATYSLVHSKIHNPFKLTLEFKHKR